MPISKTQYQYKVGWVKWILKSVKNSYPDIPGEHLEILGKSLHYRLEIGTKVSGTIVRGFDIHKAGRFIAGSVKGLERKNENTPVK